ncbi:RNase H domain-containing protein [Abeliophyllum distichum]|uniref:RNase H domain-containing protein n=1 Tax=Abeliophyllum distichum TaxID=126358 RepID=A0ABD1TJC5_9LAMI
MDQNLRDCIDNQLPLSRNIRAGREVTGDLLARGRCGFRSQQVPYTIVEHIRSITITAEVYDQIMWKDTSNGRFATKSSWQLVHTEHTIQRRIGSHMASRCQCCSTIETIQHLFIDSCIADQVWFHFSDIYHITLRSMEGFSIAFSLSASQIIHWRGDIDIAPLFGISLTTPSLSSHVLVYWRTPLVGSYKVNIDGCVKDRFASGGEIINDSSGQCVHVFFSSYGECPILEAELRAILDGIILAQRIVLSDLWIELDSTLAIQCITSGGRHWSIQATLHHIRHLITSTVILFLIFITRATRWLTYLLQRVEIVVVTSSTTLRTYCDVIEA